MKLPVSAYASLIFSFLHRLSGWSAFLLSSGGRHVLGNAISNNLDIYFMCSFLLPRGVVDAIDKRRRAFFRLTRILDLEPIVTHRRLSRPPLVTCCPVESLG
jgi:hypothetical protein